MAGLTSPSLQDDLAKTFQALGLAARLRRVTGGESMRFD
jgi:hypothetical protein